MNKPDERVLALPSTQRLKRVAAALGEFVEDVVFIGGAIVPILQTDPVSDSVRPTKDVDAVVSTATYLDLGAIGDALRARDFHQLYDTGHLHRWTSPDGDNLDLVPAGSHTGGSGQLWDRLSLEVSHRVDLGAGVEIRIASAPVFLCLKWAAYEDRGEHDPHTSHDLEDIIAVVLSRDTILAEVSNADSRIRTFLAERAGEFLRRGDRDDIIAGHVNNTQDRRYAREVTTARLRMIGQLPPTAEG